MRALVILMLLAGCTTGALVPLGAPSITLQDLDAQAAPRQSTIYANDILAINRAAGSSRASMPEGSYSKAQEVVETAELMIPEAACRVDLRDGVIDLIPFTSAGATRLTICNTANFAEIRDALQDLLPPWQPPTAAQVAAQ